MQKKIFLISLLLSTVLVQAQEPKRLSFGLKINPSIAWINAEHNDLQSDGATMKFGFGALVSYRLSSLLYAVTGVNYSTFGGYVFDSLSLNNSGYRYNYKINYSLIEIPVALKLKTQPVNNVSYYLQGGISVGIVTSANEKYKPLTTNTASVYTDIKRYTNPLWLAYQATVGIEYSIGKRASVFGEITLNNAITNSAKSELYINSGRYSDPLHLYPGLLEFSVGILF